MATRLRSRVNNQRPPVVVVVTVFMIVIIIVVINLLSMSERQRLLNFYLTSHFYCNCDHRRLINLLDQSAQVGKENSAHMCVCVRVCVDVR